MRLKQDITTGGNGKATPHLWVVPFSVVVYGIDLFVLMVLCSPHWPLTTDPKMTLNSCSSLPLGRDYKCEPLYSDVYISYKLYLKLMYPTFHFQKHTYHKVSKNISYKLSHQVNSFTVYL